MKISFGQVYIEPGVRFPFSHHFQRRLSLEITALVTPSSEFLSTYGSDYRIMFNVSAKKMIQESEIRGPTVFKRTRDVEYSVFLPFDVIRGSSSVPQAALRYLLNAVCSVLQSMNIDTKEIVNIQGSLVEAICSDPIMFRKID